MKRTRFTTDSATCPSTHCGSRRCFDHSMPDDDREFCDLDCVESYHDGWGDDE